MKNRHVQRGMDALKATPRAGWICALVGLLVAAAWSLIIPLFQVPDEPAHIAYAQYMAETGRPPSGSDARRPLSQQERLLLDAVHWKAVTHRLENRPPSGAGTQQRLEWLAEHPGEPLGGGGYTSATNNPPLYYATEAAVYHLTPSSSLANRIHVMRLLSALLAALTVLFIFLFLRELMPGTPWAWAVGALVVAFQPMFGFISGGVSSDNLLFTATAGLFWALASSFRRGLTVPRGVMIGVFAAVGTLAKINMIGLLPGAAIGLALLVTTSQPASRKESLRGAIYAVGIVAGAALVYVTLNQVAWDRGVFLGSGVGHPLGSGPARGTGNLIEAPAHSVVGAFNYAWEFYLPRLPFMPDLFVDYPLRRVWLDGFVGNFGWLDYQLPGYVYNVAKAIAVVVVILAARTLFIHRALLRDRAGELITYAAMTIGLLVLVNGNGFAVRADGGSGFEQARYLFPLLALYAAIVALAARAAGRRWGPAAGVLFVVLAIAHTAIAVLVTLTRYYG
jgi:4-amino-4-deoxy-L-arabinose transferase-like glycosyltransferase